MVGVGEIAQELRSIHGAAYAGGAQVGDVGVLHGDVDTAVAQQLLDRADVVAVLEQMGCERMAERVTGRGLRQSGSY